MSSFLKSDGHIVAPLNITKPVPGLDAQGFKWATVDAKLHGTSNVRDFDSAEPVPDTFPLTYFDKPYAGNGFNLIWRPRANGPNELPIQPGSGSETNVGPHDNILELNLTTEQLGFSPSIGNIPNRGLKTQKDIFLLGIPYVQTVQDVTNPCTGSSDHPVATPIHFENGVWLKVPPAEFHDEERPSLVRMGSIPHGTTINAQGYAPEYQEGSKIGGVKGGPKFNAADATPLEFDNQDLSKIEGPPHRFPSMNEKRNQDFRLPQNLKKFDSAGTKRITTQIIKNPNTVLADAIRGLNIEETISFQISTEPSISKLNGGGTANISFLAGPQDPLTNAIPKGTDLPIAHAPTFTANYWIERVMYDVTVPGCLLAGSQIQLRPTMPENSTAPTPVFRITVGPDGTTEPTKIQVPGIQIQSSQTVILNFNQMTWPHISVSTLVPTEPQDFEMK